MFSKIKNIIILVAIIGASVLVYIFFFKKDSSESSLTPSSPLPTSQETGTSSVNTSVDTEFLSILLSVKDIKLNNSIFSDIRFTNLKDSSIILTPDGNEGRKNPFATIGFDATPTPKVVPTPTPTPTPTPIPTPTVTPTPTPTPVTEIPKNTI